MKISELKALRAAAPGAGRLRRVEGVWKTGANGEPYTGQNLYIHIGDFCAALMCSIWRGPNGPQPEREAAAALFAAAPEAVDMACELADALDELLDAGWPGRCLAEDTARDTARALLASIGYTEASDEATP